MTPPPKRFHCSEHTFHRNFYFDLSLEPGPGLEPYTFILVSALPTEQLTLAKRLSFLKSSVYMKNIVHILVFKMDSSSRIHNTLFSQ
jgi:hypothetical protein